LMIRGAEAPVLIVTCPSRQVLTLTMRVPRPPGSPGARRLVLGYISAIRWHQVPSWDVQRDVINDVAGG
jgi:hypothetical protein